MYALLANAPAEQISAGSSYLLALIVFQGGAPSPSRLPNSFVLLNLFTRQDRFIIRVQDVTGW